MSEVCCVSWSMGKEVIILKLWPVGNMLFCSFCFIWHPKLDSFLFSKVIKTLKRFKIDETLSVCVCVCLSFCRQPHLRNQCSKQYVSNLTRWLPQSWECIAYQFLVAAILNYGHTSMSCKALVSECFLSALSVSRRMNDACHSKLTYKNMFPLPYCWRGDRLSFNQRHLIYNLITASNTLLIFNLYFGVMG